MPYEPAAEILERYADVMVNFALGTREGIAAGDVVRIVAHESAKPLYRELSRAVWRAGGHVLGHYLPDQDAAFNLERDFYELAGEAQLDFFPALHARGLVDQMDHQLFVLSEADMHALEGVEPARIMRQQRANKPMTDWRTEKENAGRFTWSICMYGTPAMAAEASMSVEEYWQQIIRACFLDDPDPIARWREVTGRIETTLEVLNSLPIERLHMHGEDVDLHLTLGERRRWIGGSGRNIPSFEIFTSPDWRGTEGRIRFNQPLYRYGSLIEDVELEFRDGRVVTACATRNEALLKEMIASENADRVGEYSLTDARFSRITRFMAETLYDENVGGPFGNTHVALGKAFHDCYDGDPTLVDEQEWVRLGFNDSSVHTDIVSTSDRTVTARLRDGSERVIYAGGSFQLD